MRAAVVLAAGEGTGAWPYCGVRQKVTVPVINEPLIRRLVRDLNALGIGEVVVVIGHRGEAVRACVADIEGVRFVEQPTRKGPVDAALRGLADVRAEDTVLCHGDIVTTQVVLADFLRAFEEAGGEPALLTTQGPGGPSHYITVQSASDGFVTGIWGHGEEDAPRFAGVAAAPTELLRRYLHRNPGIMDQVEIGAMPPVEGDIAHSFDHMRQDGIDVHAVPASGFVVDVDRPWHIMEASYAAAQHWFQTLEKTVIGQGASVDDGADIAADAKLYLEPGAHIGKGCHIGGSVALGAGSQVVRGAILQGDTFVGARTECKDYCLISPGSVLGSRCIFGHGAEFDGVTFDTVYLWHYCEIAGLMGNNVDIGAATVCGTLRFDNGVRIQNVRGHKERPARFGSSTFIGDYCRTGVNVVFMPGIKVGAYSCIGAGAILYEDVPERTLLIPKQEHILKPWGPEKYGW